MKKILFIVVLISGLAYLNSCTTDFDLYAEYQDISIVYGLLDTSDDTSWIKITKAYTGPGNALLIAQIPDSSNYPYKLDVELLGVKNGNQLTPVVLDTLTIHNKIPGDSTFYFPNQLVYYTTAPLDGNANYTLQIYNQGNEITAITPLVGNFAISHPNRLMSFTNNGKVEWDLADHGKRYELYLYFNYKEFAPGYADTLRGKMKWFMGVDTDDKGEKSYSGESFYSRLDSELEPIPNVKRWADTINLVIACGSEILNSYLDINEADNSLLTEVPVFTNIEGGTGIFASRHSAFKDVTLTPKSLEKLIEEYPELGFQYPTK